ncbi:hypothetical protein LOTGIDRAFT_133362 [Lottia gigantea]|uniref:Cytochrome P450 family 20 subfamily A member 1 n=1 Tax=Lottia gigantea TaxID=225164 RepID=V4B4S2_LOTGI|nr:hypothetical protein LOTGIDRAFT_133362 [Lottia gigantea]ESO83424.1 hypothetical protein LOTGIDRAFT_133362 [Lottia gigantea]
MLDFAIFAVTFFMMLVGAVIYLMPSSRKATSVPGLDPTTKEDGNLSDIGRAGSLHEFLLDLHGRFGDIASFWMGRQLVISIASPELFKQHQNNLKHVVTQSSTLCYTVFMFIGNINTICIQVADNLVKTLENKVKEEHLSLNQYMIAYAFKTVMNSLYGDAMDDEKDIIAMRGHYDIMWSEMEKRIADPTVPEDGSPRAISLNLALKEMRKIVQNIIDFRKKNGKKSEDYLLIDRIVEHMKTEDGIFSEILTFLIGGFHTAGNLLTWAVYFLATHEEVEKKLLKEIKNVLGDDDISADNYDQLKYTKQIIDETMRCAVVAPWAARYQDFDSELGGHKIPKKTPVIHALGVSLQDERQWPQPKIFDPERFNEENIKKRPHLAFSPFGFAGRRVCPGRKFAYLESAICLVSLFRRFKFHLVEGQVVQPVFGLVTHSEDDIWVTVSKRK